MGILPPVSANSDNKLPPMVPITFDREQRAASRFLHSKDPTGGLLSTVLFMDSVEDWVINRLELEPEQVEQVRIRLRRIAEILTQYSDRVAPDNQSLVQLLSWMKSSESLYTLDYLTQAQPEFTVQFIRHCQSVCDDDVNARLALERITVLFRSRLLDRVYSPANFDYVTTVLMEMSQ